MMAICASCGIAHASESQADITHQAMADVRAWFRDQVLAGREPIQKPSMRPANVQPVGGPLEKP